MTFQANALQNPAIPAQTQDCAVILKKVVQDAADTISVFTKNTTFDDSKTIDDLKDEYAKQLSELQREEDYGQELKDLPEEVQSYIDSVFSEAMNSGELEENVLEEGVTEYKADGWTKTVIDTYGGLKFSELSLDKQTAVQNYEEELAKWEALSDEEKAILAKPELPEELAKETEIRIQHDDFDFANFDPEPTTEEPPVTPPKGPTTEELPWIDLPPFENEPYYINPKEQGVVYYVEDGAQM